MQGLTERIGGRIIGRITGRAARLAAAGFAALLAGLTALSAPVQAAAPTTCGGTDELAALASKDPAAYAEVFARAAKVRNGKGVFWKVGKPGVPPSYLLGTFHDTEIAARPLKPAVAAALTGARVMLVEVTLDEQKNMKSRMMTDPSFVMGHPAINLSAMLSAAERTKAETALEARGLSLAMADKVRPALLMSMLAQPTCALKALGAGKPVLDSMLMHKAEAAGVPVKGMETYEAALASIEKLPHDVIARLLVESVRNLGALEDFRKTAVALYGKGEIGVLQAYEVWQAEQDLGKAEADKLYDALTRRVVEDRNAAWMPVMLPELEKGGVFAAFGAMHLIGDHGIIALLRQHGFEVTRADG